jgi:hypothetical protein
MNRGILRIIIEMDSSILASALWSDSFDHSPEGVIYHDLLNLHFVLVDVFVVPRSYNHYALSLAHSDLARDRDAPSI